MEEDTSKDVRVEPYYIRANRRGLWHTVVSEYISGPNHIVVNTACNGIALFKHEGKVMSTLPPPGQHCYNCRRVKC